MDVVPFGAGSCLTWLVLLWSCIAAFGGQRQGGQTRLDRYGGDRSIQGKRTGFFHLEKISRQWVFITPAGHGLFPRSVAAIYFTHPGLTPEGETYKEIVEAKYRKPGDEDVVPARERWANKVRKRLRLWGFNAIGPYSYAPVTPDKPRGGTYYRNTRGIPPNPLPFVVTQANMERPMRTGDVKNLWSSLRGRGHNLGNAFFADVFDPRFAEFVEQEAEKDARRLKERAEESRWILFGFVEQTDWMRGVEGRHPHLGWAAAASNFHVSEGVVDFAGRKKRYANPKVYTKYAVRDFLKAKYHKIQNLNRAWGTNYTDWDSKGGWGKGTGFLDEDGARLGKPHAPGNREHPAMRQDLDAFAEKIMRRFYQTVYTIRKKKCPEILLATNNMATPHEYVVKGLVSEDRRQTYADIICISNRKRAAQWYRALKRPFFVISIFAQAINDSPLGYRGSVTKVEYEEVLHNGKTIVTGDPTRNPSDRKVVNDWKSRVVVTASGVDFWWAKHRQLKIPYRTYTQFAPALVCRTYAGKFENVRFASRPWKSMDWLARDKFAVHQEHPGTYFALKQALKPAHEFWRYEPWNSKDTQEERGKLYHKQVIELINTRAPEGDHVYCGFNYWAWWDTSWTGITWDAAYNFGLVTFHDNAYDGKEAVWALGTGEDGYPIGGEVRPPHIAGERKGFGDFLTGVRKTNQEVQETIARRCQSKRP